MPDNELTVLVINAASVQGGRYARARGATGRAASGAWPITSPTSVNGEAAAAEAADGLTAALRQAASALGASSAAVALPTSRIMVRVLRLPPVDSGSMADVVRLQMEKVVPFGGDELNVGFEVLQRDDQGVRIFAAGASTSVLESVGAGLKAAGIRPLRLDAALLDSWQRLVAGGGLTSVTGRRAILIDESGEWDLLICDDGVPVAARGLGLLPDPADVSRELALSLMAAEMEVGPAALEDVLVVGTLAPGLAAALEAASGQTPRAVRVQDLPPVGQGLAERSWEAGRLDLTPASWRAAELSARSRRRFLTIIGAAGLLWLLAAASLLAVPIVLRRMTESVTAQVTGREDAYRRAADIRSRVRLIQSYMDRRLSPLETLRLIASIQPVGVDLSILTYRRDEGARLGGDAAERDQVLAFKDALDSSGLFRSSSLIGPTLVPGQRRYRFEIDAKFPEVAE